MSIDELMHSVSPTDRARAAAQLVRNPEAVQTRDLVRALQRETVPQVRRLLNEVLQARQRSSLRGEAELAGPGGQAEAIGSSTWEAPDLAALIRHELSPAVGWIRLAADDEIDNFSSSKTSAAVGRLQRRIDGLMAMIRSESAVTFSNLTVPEAVLQSWPDPSNVPAVEPPIGSASVDIRTDEGLLALLFSNVFQNAIDASMDAVGRPQVDIHWGYTAVSFWIRVVNPFKGDRFMLDEVVEVGRSSKTTHQGHGLDLVRRIADRLGLTISLEGVNGAASFVVSGLIDA